MSLDRLVRVLRVDLQEHYFHDPRNVYWFNEKLLTIVDNEGVRWTFPNTAVLLVEDRGGEGDITKAAVVA